MSNLKTFILQHEIITPGYENHVIKAGTIIRETLQKTANGNVIFRADNGDIFTDTYVIDNPLWFKPECELKTEIYLLEQKIREQRQEFEKLQLEKSQLEAKFFHLENLVDLKDKIIDLLKSGKVEEPEAVRFAKWVSPHTHIFGKGWYLPCENQQYFTTEELYSKFKQETK